MDTRSAPNRILSYTEIPRTVVEYASLLALGGWAHSAPKGDGHSIFLIPGFLASDKSLKILHRFLTLQGYDPNLWGMGQNLGFRAELFEGALDKIERIHSSTGKKVSLVGQSLGGVYVRELAKFIPHAVRQVITLGTSVDPHAKTTADEMYHALNPANEQEKLPDDLELPPNAFEIDVPPPVPCTGIFSKGDGVVHWRSCVQDGDYSYVESIQAPGSHCGMGMNPAILHLVAHRLAQAEGEWRKYHVPMHLWHTYRLH